MYRTVQQGSDITIEAYFSTGNTSTTTGKYLLEVRERHEWPDRFCRSGFSTVFPGRAYVV